MSTMIAAATPVKSAAPAFTPFTTETQAERARARFDGACCPWCKSPIAASDGFALIGLDALHAHCAAEFDRTMYGPSAAAGFAPLDVTDRLVWDCVGGMR